VKTEVCSQTLMSSLAPASDYPRLASCCR